MRQWALLIAVSVMMYGSSAWAQTNFEAKNDVTVTNSATLVLAGNAFRYSVSCTNTSSSVHVRWGDSAVTDSKGKQLRAGS
jgi:hypothetical protein